MTELVAHQTGFYVENSPLLFVNEFARQQWLLCGREVTGSQVATLIV